MKYKFEITYIPVSFIDANPNSSPADEEFRKACSSHDIEVDYNTQTSMEEAKQQIINAYKTDGFIMVNILGFVRE